MVQQLLMKWGIPTYVYSVQTLLAGAIEEKIGDTLEVTVGWVYGISVNVDGKTPDNANNLITAGNTANLYLNLKYGQSIYVNGLRLNHLVFDQFPGAGPLFNQTKYLEVNIPVGTDLKQSTYSNPTLLTAAVVMINLFYIDVTAYQFLIDKNIILENGQALPKVRRQSNQG